VKIHSAFLSLCLLVLGVSSACSVEPTKAEESNIANSPAVSEKATNTTSGSMIEIKAGSPADTVRAFYQKLRERRIREAIFLTNLRPAIEGLTDDELKEFAVDFEAVAKNVPTEIEINGEIVSGDIATVTAKLPDENNEKLEVQQIRLRKEGENWIILSADDEAEKRIRKEGKNYFLSLRIDTHHEEAKKMLDRIAKAEMVHSLQNEGRFAEFSMLIAEGLLPSDVTTSESTGYNYALNLASDAKSYTVSATPAVYGKSGKMSFLLELDKDGKPKFRREDKAGKPIGK